MINGIAWINCELPSCFPHQSYCDRYEHERELSISQNVLDRGTKALLSCFRHITIPTTTASPPTVGHNMKMYKNQRCPICHGQPCRSSESQSRVYCFIPTLFYDISSFHSYSSERQVDRDDTSLLIRSKNPLVWSYRPSVSHISKSPTRRKEASRGRCSTYGLLKVSECLDDLCWDDAGWRTTCLCCCIILDVGLNDNYRQTIVALGRPESPYTVSVTRKCFLFV
jgi:hypothetical protein